MQAKMEQEVRRELDDLKVEHVGWLDIPEDVKIIMVGMLGIVDRMNVSKVSPLDYKFTRNARCVAQKVKIYEKDKEIRIAFWKSPKDGEIRICDFNGGAMITFLYGIRQSYGKMIYWLDGGYYKERIEQETTRESVFLKVLDRTLKFVDAQHLDVGTGVHFTEEMLARLTVRVKDKLLGDSDSLPFVQKYLECNHCPFTKLDVQNVGKEDDPSCLILQNFDVSRLTSINIQCKNDADNGLLMKMVNVTMVDIRRSKIDVEGIIEFLKTRMRPGGLNCRYDVEKDKHSVISKLKSDFKLISELVDVNEARRMFDNRSLLTGGVLNNRANPDESHQLFYVDKHQRPLQIYAGINKEYIDYYVELANCNHDPEKHQPIGPWIEENFMMFNDPDEEVVGGQARRHLEARWKLFPAR